MLDIDSVTKQAPRPRMGCLPSVDTGTGAAMPRTKRPDVFQLAVATRSYSSVDGYRKEIDILKNELAQTRQRLDGQARDFAREREDLQRQLRMKAGAPRRRNAVGRRTTWPSKPRRRSASRSRLMKKRNAGRALRGARGSTRSIRRGAFIG